MQRARLLMTALAVVVLASACNGHARPAAVQALPSASAATSPSPAAAVATTAPPTAAPPSATASPKPAPPSYDVKAVQARLLALHYYGGVLHSAVMAFQKVNGLSADGSIGPRTLAALKHPVTPTLRGSGGGTRVEVDLTKQVLYLVKGGVIVRILPVSSGSGAHYVTAHGSRATALSPVGHYVIQRRIVGERHAELGTLYDPQYFYKGWAIHGSNSVPGYPASHGCTRVTRADAKFLLREIGVGTPVYVYGGTHVFTAGSSAPGTDDPGGDTAAAPVATPAASPAASPHPGSTPTPTPTPTPTTSATPTATPTVLPSP